MCYQLSEIVDFRERWQRNNHTKNYHEFDSARDNITAVEFLHENSSDM